MEEKNSRIDLDKIELDEEELEIQEVFEKGELRTTKNSKKLIEWSQIAARNYFAKKACINIMVTEADLTRIKLRAVRRRRSLPDSGGKHSVQVCEWLSGG